MIYRPQFKFPTPDGYRDVPHEYAMNVFPNGILANATGDFTPFKMADDADFYIRAITGLLNAGPLNALINFRDPWENLLFSDDILVETVLGGLAGPAYILNEEIWCPAGSVFWTRVVNLTNGTINVTPVLRGVKRCRACEYEAVA